MCLIVLQWNPNDLTPLRLAGNRDELYARSAQPLHAWNDSADLYAGQDLEAGGIWLGITASGRFAALTNVRRGTPQAAPRSRGDLALNYLRGTQSPADYLETLVPNLSQYRPFNLLLGDLTQLWHLNSLTNLSQSLATGIHAISNADLGTPWPKVKRAQHSLSPHLQNPDPPTLLTLLRDSTQAPDTQLPDTGIGLERERLLSPVFIHSAHYGTCASTVLLLRHEGEHRFLERRFGSGGRYQSDTDLRIPVTKTP